MKPQIYTDKHRFLNQDKKEIKIIDFALISLIYQCASV